MPVRLGAEIQALLRGQLTRLRLLSGPVLVFFIATMVGRVRYGTRAKARANEND
jgi:hypothetical protein